MTESPSRDDRTAGARAGRHRRRGAILPWQFDEYVWFDETRAVTPLGTEEVRGMPETYPFGL